MFGSIGSALGISADAAFGGVTSAAGALYANQEAKRAAKRQMEFQAQMSNTGYQRAMQDMKAAGLNPILAGKLGAASSPGGAMYQPGNIGQAFVQGVGGVASAQQSLSSAGLASEQTAKVMQDKDFAEVVHDERWPRLFATMSPENVAASGLAVVEGVPIKQVLANENHQLNDQERKNLERFLYRVQGFKGTIAREMSGVGQKVDAATKFMADVIRDMMKELTQ